jgi:hypothetical protein
VYLFQPDAFQKHALVTGVYAGQQLDLSERETEPFGEKAAEFLIGRAFCRLRGNANLERVTVPSREFCVRRLRLGVNQQNSSLIRFVGRLTRSQIDQPLMSCTAARTSCKRVLNKSRCALRTVWSSRFRHKGLKMVQSSLRRVVAFA